MSKRLLVVNVHYSPNSFGGATVVAENVTRELVAQHGWQALVVTAVNQPGWPRYSLIRYRAKGVDVAAINVPMDELDYQESYDNPHFDAKFQKIVSAFRPDVAHVHCVQNIGANLIASLKKAAVPTAVTIHDCWWLCERQFMITSGGRYCHQTEIDEHVCIHCVVDPKAAARRRSYLTDILDQADLYLFPSEFHRQLHIANGLPAEKCVVNKNGVKLPGPGFAKKPITDPDIRVRFGYVGGPGVVKGGPLILLAFRDIATTNYELVVVDAAQNIGRSWQNDDWRVPGKLRLAPAYNAETIDEFFSSIDVLLFPSQWKESFGLTVREALARDIWVIATDAGGVAEDCRDGIDSNIIPMNGNPEPLKEAISACIEKGNWAEYENKNAGKLTTVVNQASALSTLLIAAKQKLK